MILAKLSHFLHLSRRSRLGFRTAVLALLGSALAMPCMALPDDRQQPISIESDYAERNEKTGRTVYRGNVVISQGSVLIEAEEITLHVENSKISRIECTGKHNAMLTRDGTIIKGDSIDYDIDKQTWKAKGDNQGQQKRIQLVIPASALQSDSTVPETQP
jgi:lipopolysaccharide export system protein LptA